MSGLGRVHTRQDAEAFVARCLGDYAVEHDVPAIADACRDLVGVWNVALVEPEDFWRLVRLHALDDAGREVAAPRDGDGNSSRRRDESGPASAPRDGGGDDVPHVDLAQVDRDHPELRAVIDLCVRAGGLSSVSDLVTWEGDTVRITPPASLTPEQRRHAAAVIAAAIGVVPKVDQ